VRLNVVIRQGLSAPAGSRDSVLYGHSYGRSNILIGIARNSRVHCATAPFWNSRSPIEVILTNLPTRPIAQFQVAMLLLDNARRRGA
jgi:hypothetical protein